VYKRQLYEVAEETEILQVSEDCGYLWNDVYAT